MPLYEIYEKTTKKMLFPDRAGLIADLKKDSKCDILIIGGGIQGATLAHLASFNGLKVVLLEKNDYASGDSSNTQKLLIANDLRTSRKNVDSMKALFRVATHNITPIALTINKSIPLGLRIRNFFNTRLLTSFKEKNIPLLLDASYRPTRYTLDRIFAARQEGARCLNYAQVQSYYQQENGSYNVSWIDTLTGSHFVINTGAVVNCAGINVNSIGRLNSKLPVATRLIEEFFYKIEARVTALSSSIFFEKDNAVTVYNNGQDVLIGPFTKEIKESEQDILNKINKWLKHNLSLFNFDDTPYKLIKHSYLKPLRKKSSYRIDKNNAIYSIIGGTTLEANQIAEECLKDIFKISHKKIKVTSLNGRKLSGTALYNEYTNEFIDLCKSMNIPSNIYQSCIKRWGSRVIHIPDFPNAFSIIDNKYLNGEISLAKEYEQAETQEDIERRL